MKPLEFWTCQRAENLKKKSSKIPKNNYAATMVSAARRQIIGGGGAPINKSRQRRRRGRRTALSKPRESVLVSYFAPHHVLRFTPNCVLCVAHGCIHVSHMVVISRIYGIGVTEKSPTHVAPRPDLSAESLSTLSTETAGPFYLNKYIEK